MPPLAPRIGLLGKGRSRRTVLGGTDVSHRLSQELVPCVFIEPGMPCLPDDDGFQRERQIERAEAGAHRFGGAADVIRHGCDQIVVRKRGKSRLGKGHGQDDAAFQAKLRQRLVNGAVRPPAP